MRRSALGPPPPRPRNNTAPVILAGIAVVLLSVLVIWWRAPSMRAAEEESEPSSGSRSVAELQPVLLPGALDSTVRVAIVRDPASDEFYATAERLDVITRTWENALRDIGAEVQVVQPAEARDSRVADVLVFPSSPCLGLDSYEAMTAARARGQGIVATWITGTRDGSCARIGWGVLVRLTDASRFDTLDTRDEAYVTIPAGTALSSGLPPGARMELLAGNHVAARRQGRAAFWSDYSLNPEPAQRLPLLDGAIVHHERDGVRAVYLGFELTSVVDRPWERSIMKLLVRNAIGWAAGRALVAPEAWPSGRRYAAVIAQDVEDQFANARFALDTLRAVGVPATFFVVSDLALDHAELVRDLDRHGEIGTHSENHRRLGGLSRLRQVQRLERTQRDLATLTGDRVAGLRPPEEQFDAATIAAWRESGGQYLFAANNGRAASPEIVRIGESESVLLARVVNDDFDVMVRMSLRDPEAITDIFMRDQEKVRALGGLYMLSYHSQFLARPEHVAALGSVARRLAADTAAWVATAGEVATWWKTRQALEITTIDDAGSLLVRVRNDSRETIDDLVLALVPPRNSAAGSGSTSGARLLGAENGVWRLALDPIGAGATGEVRIIGGASADGVARADP